MKILLKRDDVIRISRNPRGVLRVEALTEEDLYYGQGFAQARDRAQQMILTRTLGQGRASEILGSTEEMLELDLFFRRMNWTGAAAELRAELSIEDSRRIQAFCDGVSAYITKHTPALFRLLRHKPDPWRPEDCILFVRMLAYISLQQTQSDIQRLIIEMVQAGIDREKLEELFPNSLNELDMSLASRIKLGRRIVPENLNWAGVLPIFTASNNWALSGKKTESGSAIYAGDPHLEGNRIPCVFQEMILECKSRYAIGASFPGVPFLLIGRNNDVSWGATYSYMDSCDTWVERCRGGKYERKTNRRSEWVRFRERSEVIKRKKKPPYRMIFHENEHGILDGNPMQEGYYLTERWSGSAITGAKSIESLFRMLHVKNTSAAMETLGNIEVTFNWVIADSKDAIGYQMSGLMPRRRKGVNGLVPLPGWDSKNAWSGFIPINQLPRRYNPPEGFIITANNNLNMLGNTSPINVPIADYRAQRIKQLLQTRSDFTVEDMRQIQGDVYSIQAEKFLEILRPLLPDDRHGKLLSEWDCAYLPNSRAANLFEKFYRSLNLLVFGNDNMGRKVVQHLLDETSIFCTYFGSFDRILLSEESRWFAGRSREDIYKQAWEDIEVSVIPRQWSSINKIEFLNIVWKGSFADMMNFGRGPYPLPGGRATILQGQSYRSGGRMSSYVPVYRSIADLGKPGLHTNLAGGPSEKRFSRYYVSDLNRWLHNRLKEILPSSRYIKDQ